MKSIFTLTLVLAFLYSKAQTLYPSGVTNCIARYTFTANQPTITTLQDASGNANNSNLVQNLVAAPSWRGLTNKAMLFNGTSSYAMIPNSSTLTPQAITMAALVKMNGFYSGSCQFSQVICKGYPGYIPGQYGLGLSDDVFDHSCSNYSATHQQLIGYFNNSYSVSGMQPTAGNYVNTTTWYFLAIAFDGANLRYYQIPMDSTFHYANVAPIYSAAISGNTMGTNTQSISIGKHTNPSFPYWFNGVMDEVVLFNTLLTPTEIQSVYDFLWVVMEVDPAFTKTDLCQGGSFTLPFKINAANAFQPGNIITAQLSDAAGSFASPTDIGFTTAIASGTINCTIPAGIPFGSNYRIRLKSSAPFEYSDVFESIFTITSTTTPPAVSITVNPGTNVAAGQLVTFTANPANAGTNPSFAWKKNGAAIPGETAITYSTTSISNNDVISVVVISSDPCATPKSAESSTLTMTVTPNAINDVTDYVSDCSLYPNPNNGSFNISGNTEKDEPIYLEVRNILGQKVYSDKIIPKKGMIKHNINITNPMPSGVYLLVLNQSYQKMVKTFNVIRK